MNTNSQVQSPDDDLEARFNDAWNSDSLYHHENGNKIHLSTLPHFLSRSECEDIYASANTLNQALERIARYLIDDKPDHPDFSNHVGYLAFNQAQRKHGRLTFLSRLDFIIDTDRQPRFIEINSACPAFFFFTARLRALSSRFLDIPIEAFPFLLDQPHYVASKMLDLAKQYYAAPDHPHVAVVTGKINSTLELSLMAHRFEQSGATVWSGSLENLTMIGNRLCDETGRPIDVVYLKDNPPPSINKGWTEEDYSRYAGYLEAIRQDVVCALNPFPGLTVMDDKGLFAFIWTDEAELLFDSKALNTLRQLIPETRLVDSSDTQQMQALSEQQSELILKPRLESRSRLIILGKDVDQKTWKQALTNCQPQQWLVQKFCTSEAPIDTSGSEQNWSRCASIGLVDGEPAGIMTSRIAPGSISSATTGASGQAVFIQP